MHVVMFLGLICLKKWLRKGEEGRAIFENDKGMS